MTNYNLFSIPDSEFIRGNVPMTKEEVRALTIGKLRIRPKDIILDIGAGTGSISIEAALFAKEGIIYSIERKQEGIKLIEKNIKLFNIKNIKLIKGIAPNDLGNVPMVDKVFIGGSGGKIKEIFDWVDDNLKSHGRLVINVITIENLYKALEQIKRRKYKNIEVVQIAVSKGENIGNLTMMKGQNPVYIISADKEC
ncbi:precorrin-6Y C5,15-methyltransferase (decarboxylating) subunit CbiT [Thermohalobacter berrensis]|uniref:Precorrin-6Y C5,15-methyltransferase (Decarboxylating) subunit CbiT n=1 Tax=Thermohalobacter berrensis TaxID=99594 RepID=A0A419SZK2_9FIRM|nr:precorrin-6Y C5,15-methyltransferase (decarboxylating) subunit CbiT [Thermohalobacter berrensis]RKD30598.1 precorrin-6Y C5,15-methyltransferase (decarboxylating) subunit CbiT [Thermohalobacter berrensis]